MLKLDFTRWCTDGSRGRLRRLTEVQSSKVLCQSRLSVWLVTVDVDLERLAEAVPASQGSLL